MFLSPQLMDICPFSEEELHYFLKLSMERFTLTNHMTVISNTIIVLLNDTLKE